MEEKPLQEYVDSAQSVIEDSPQMQEATTKASLLNDFVELLGWEIPKNTELEYSVKAFGKTHKVDYALLLGGQPSAFLEAKGLDTPLTFDFREKFEDYLRGENVNWGILTNGEEYEFYQRRVIDSTVKVELIEQTTLEQLPSKSKIIEAYQPEMIRDKESEVIIGHIRELRGAWETLTEEKDELATAVVDTLTESVSDAIESDAESQAKEMIDRLITDIELEIDTDASQIDGSHSAPESDEDPPTTPASYFVELTQAEQVVETFEDSIQSDLLASVVNYLIQSQNLMSAIEPLPYIPGKKRAIINDEPTYNGEEMAQPRELGQEYYLEVNLSWGQKKREMERLADACGVEVDIEE
jgi:hypothetical protein